MPLDLQPRAWDTRRADKARRLARTAPLTSGKVLPTEKATEALEALLEPGDKVPVVLIAYGRSMRPERRFGGHFVHVPDEPPLAVRWAGSYGYGRHLRAEAPLARAF